MNKEKDANNDADYEEPTVTDYPVFKEPIYLTYLNVEILS